MGILQLVDMRQHMMVRPDEKARPVGTLQLEAVSSDITDTGVRIP